MLKGKKVVLSITSSKRIDLLEMTLRSFSVFCRDLEIIDQILLFDDCSSSEERNRSINLIHNYIPNRPVMWRYFEKDTFPDKMRHARIMNIWLESLETFGSDYVFHLEDDWQFLNLFSITEGVEIMEENEEYAYVSYAYPERKIPPGYECKRKIGNFWEPIFLEERGINDLLFLDPVAAIQDFPNNPSYWCYYLNWPYFGLRPGVHHCRRLLSIGKFLINTGSSFELDFAIRYKNRGLKSMACSNLTCVHTGNNRSSYDLNSSLRTQDKSEKNTVFCDNPVLSNFSDFLKSEKSPKSDLPIFVQRVFDNSTGKCVVFNTEQLTRNDRDFICDFLSNEKIEEIWDYSLENIAILNSRGITKTRHVPLVLWDSYREELESLDSSIEYDVGFCGGVSPRREKILSDLEDLGFSVCRIYGENGYVLGNERDGALKKCSVILNIHYREDYKIFESSRCFNWLDIGKTVISESSMGEDSRSINCKYEDLVETVAMELNRIKNEKN
jgi:hypothetical protein